MLETVTVTEADVLVFPLVSRATALSAWEPLTYARVSQESE